jgi:hydrogenase maturation protein HypF
LRRQRRAHHEHGLQFIRRARGYTPRAIKLPISGPSVLAVGGWFKNTICVTRGDEAFVSQHIGDLDNAAVCDFLEENVAQMVKLLGVEPAIVAHDLHPDFHSTRFAADFAAATSPAAARCAAPPCACRGRSR